MSFANLKPRDKVTFLIPNGTNRFGEITWKKKTGRVVMTFANHVVVNGGGRHGTPYVVDANNFISPKSAKV